MSNPRVALLTIDDRGMMDDALETIGCYSGGEYGVEWWIHVDDSAHELGFCGAIREGWERLRALAAERPFDYVLHWECDFRALREFDVRRMAQLLDRRPDLAQVALRRGPINAAEIAAGGVVEQWSHEVCSDFSGTEWIEHAKSFTTNPCLYRRSLLDREWPEAPECEGRFGYQLAQEGYRFAYLGPPGEAGIMVEHVGTRIGHSY